MTTTRVEVRSICAICGTPATRNEPGVVTLGLVGNGTRSVSFAAHLGCVVEVLTPGSREVALQLAEARSPS